MARDEIDEAGVAVATEPVETSTENTEPAPDQAAPAEATPEPPKPAGPSAEEIETAFNAFMTLADEASARRDVASGDPTEVDVASVVEAYKKLPGTSVKTRARNTLAERMNAALGERLDASEARSYMQLGLAVKSAGSPRETVAKAPVDPTEAFVAQLAAMFLAPNLIKVPDGIEPDYAQRAMALVQAAEVPDQVALYKSWLDAKQAWDVADEATRGDAPAEPEVSDLIKAAARIARGRAGSAPRAARTASTSTRVASGIGYSGPTRNVLEHMRQAFDGKPIGTFLKIGEIAGFSSTEYGSDHPSSGAVTARLFPAGDKKLSAKVSEIGIEPVIDNGIKGARKVA